MSFINPLNGYLVESFWICSSFQSYITLDDLLQFRNAQYLSRPERHFGNEARYQLE